VVQNPAPHDGERARGRVVLPFWTWEEEKEVIKKGVSKFSGLLNRNGGESAGSPHLNRKNESVYRTFAGRTGKKP